jgi:hypothetical protein
VHLTADLFLQGLPAVSAADTHLSPDWYKWLPDVLLALLVSGYLLATCWQLAGRLTGASQEQDHMPPFWLALEGLLCSLLVASMVLLAVFNLRASPAQPLHAVVHAYDSNVFAPARFMLPARHALNAGQQPVAAAGHANRWKLPADFSGLQAVADMMQGAHGLFLLQVRLEKCRCWAAQ